MPDLTIHEAAQAFLDHLRAQGKKAGFIRIISFLSSAFLDHLRAQGKKERTLYTYGKDFQIIESFFGAEKPLASIRTPQVGKFFKSDHLLRMPSGKERAKPTLDKIVRVLRMFLVSCHTCIVA